MNATQLTIRNDKSSVATTRRHGCGDDDDDDDGRALTTPNSHSRYSQQTIAGTPYTYICIDRAQRGNQIKLLFYV